MHYFVGDIQGCDSALEQLLHELDFSPSRDRLTVLGDMVNRGPQSLRVLRRLMNLGGACDALLGNHDLQLLATAAGARAPSRKDTLEEILQAPDRDALFQWICHRPLAIEREGWLCVHAGVVPSWSRKQTLQLAQEVCAALQGKDRLGFLHAMYGNSPQRWDDGLQGHARIRAIVNVLTRIRFCQEDGTLDLDTKESADAAPLGHRPWFEFEHRQTRDVPIAFGHWSTLGLVNRPTLLALDTGCVWGGCLSAARVDGGRRDIVQVKCEQAQQPGKGA